VWGSWGRAVPLSTTWGLWSVAVSSPSGVRGEASVNWRFRTFRRLTKPLLADIKFLSEKLSWGSRRRRPTTKYLRGSGPLDPQGIGACVAICCYFRPFIFIDHFSGPGRTIGLVNVSVFVWNGITLDLDIWYDGSY